MNEEAKLINIESDFEKALAERETIEAELKKLTEKEAQKAHHIELLRNRYKEEKRRSRTHRLIERGAILESILPDAESYSNDQIKHILRVAFSSLPVDMKGAYFHDNTDE
ncbi:DUF3847 domain-containing protein [Ruminococcus flavefaciens]|uniref:DUF3847 domain-containing protein n=1 Tax=Ruminococcus flavefaciens 007c TaxID=1341157 RepID=W7UUW1_RUMFL|nr:DUF3847 domain-containing protein [Ruminococcus flavefaciens]EWM52600.1 hypothetical protein RF007C_00530 [Ruminococcus flavefaciens 007c]